MSETTIAETNAFVPVFIYGATLAGIGLSSAIGERSFLAEPSAMIGREFIASFHPGQNWENEPASAAAQQLRDELLRRNLLSSEGKVHLPPIAPVLFNRVRTESLNVRMMTRIVEVETTASKHLITLHNASGLQQITAGCIVDTTSTCASAPFYNPRVSQRKINAMLHCPQSEMPAEMPQVADENVEIVSGLFPGELILKFGLEPNDDWIAARHKLHRYWMNRPEVLRPWTLAAVADEFEIGAPRGPHCIAEKWFWLPSCAYDNLLEGFDAGVLYAAEIHEGDGVHEALATG